ncbi:MAG: ferritin-like domain-containing protein [Anaerohalosphaeraceae bacterium]
MVITHENLIVLLNMDLELEEAAALQYVNHAAMLTGAAYRHVSMTLRAFAYRKIRHAMTLAEAIHYLGGCPTLRVGNVHTSEYNEDMLVCDFDDEQDAVRRYKVRIEQAEQLKEIALAKHLWAILRTEQQHVMYIKKQLSDRAHQDEKSTLDINDACDLVKNWAQRASQVPVRIKRQN